MSPKMRAITSLATKNTSRAAQWLFTIFHFVLTSQGLVIQGTRPIMELEQRKTHATPLLSDSSSPTPPWRQVIVKLQNLLRTKITLTFGIKSKHSVTVVGRSRTNDRHPTKASTCSLIRKASGIPTMTHTTTLYMAMHTKCESLSEWTLTFRVIHAMKQPITSTRTL